MGDFVIKPLVIPSFDYEHINPIKGSLSSQQKKIYLFMQNSDNLYRLKI